MIERLVLVFRYDFVLRLIGLLIFFMISQPVFSQPMDLFSADALGADNLGPKTMGLVGEMGIIDQAGRKINVKSPFQRVISLYGAHTENLYALGAAGQLIGVSKSSDFPAEAARKLLLSQRDDLEKFLSVRPDLVLIRPMIDRAYARLVGQLENYGIVVVSLQPATLNEMAAYWQVLGRLVGREPAAGEMVSTFTRQRMAIQVVTQTLNPKKRVYFEAIHKKMKTFTATAMAISALNIAGGINVADDARSVRGTNIAFFGKERILSRGSRIDVYLAQRGTMNPASVEQILNEPGFDAIKAVGEGQVYTIDEAIVSRPTMRLISGICEIGAILYPNLFPVSFPGICKSYEAS